MTDTSIAKLYYFSYFRILQFYLYLYPYVILSSLLTLIRNFQSISFAEFLRNLIDRRAANFAVLRYPQIRMQWVDPLGIDRIRKWLILRNFYHWNDWKHGTLDSLPKFTTAKRYDTTCVCKSYPML